MRVLGLTSLAALALCMCGLAVAQGPAPPGAGASTPASGSVAAPAAASPHHHAGRPAARPVNLNTASRAELMKLPGIGEAQAQRIVDGRPYKSKADLVSKNVLDLAAYDRLKRQVVVDHRKAASRPKPATTPPAQAAASKPTS